MILGELNGVVSSSVELDENTHPEVSISADELEELSSDMVQS